MTETYRLIRPEDYDDLFALASEWPVVRQLGGWKWPPDPEQIRSRSKPYEGEGFVWAICRDDRLIGTIGVTGGSIGYCLRMGFHRQGIMRRAATRAIKEAFETTAHTGITGTTWIDNDGSDALLRELGFVHWQTRYERSIARGYPVLTRRYRLSRAAWLERAGQTA